MHPLFQCSNPFCQEDWYNGFTEPTQMHWNMGTLEQRVVAYDHVEKRSTCLKTQTLFASNNLSPCLVQKMSQSSALIIGKGNAVFEAFLSTIHGCPHLAAFHAHLYIGRLKLSKRRNCRGGMGIGGYTYTYMLVRCVFCASLPPPMVSPLPAAPPLQGGVADSPKPSYKPLDCL